MIALVIGIAVALGAVALVLGPIVWPQRVVRPADAPVEAEDDPREHRKDLALAALKEIEFDRATGKLDEADYERMKAAYTAEALEAIRAADAAAAEPAEVPQEPALAKLRATAGVVAGHGLPGDDPAEALIAAKRKAAKGGRKFCSACGAELEGAGKFCVECGQKAG